MYVTSNCDYVQLSYYNELKNIFNSGKYNIYWKNLAYILRKDKNNTFYVEYIYNNNSMALHSKVKNNMVVKNHKIEDFIFISCTVKPRPSGRGYKAHRR